MRLWTVMIPFCLSFIFTGCASFRPNLHTNSVFPADGGSSLKPTTIEHENANHEVVVSRIIHAPKNQVWAMLADYENIYKYVSGVKFSEHVGGPRRGVGAVRRCDVMLGLKLFETVTHWEEGRSYTVTVESPMPLKPQIATLSIREMGPMQTKITMRVRYGMKGGAIGEAMNVIAMKSFMKRNLTGMLRDMDKYQSTNSDL